MATREASPVKDRFSSLDTLALAREIRALGRAHVDKAFDLGPGEWSLTLRAPGRGRRELRLVPGRFGALSERSVERSEELGPLARDLRRLLSGTAIEGVRDPGGERTLEVELRRAEDAGPRLLAVEFFGRGNVVVVRDGSVAAVAFPHTWAHRTLRVGAEYRPAPRRSDPWRADVDELRAALEGSRTDRVTTLAARLGFGGPVAEELLSRTGLAPSEPATQDATGAAEALGSAIRGLFADVGTEPRGFLYRSDETPVDVEPFPSNRWRGAPGMSEIAFPSFSAAAEAFFLQVPAASIPPAPESSAERDRAALERQRVRQEKAIAALEGEVSSRRAQGDAIYAHYEEVERYLVDAGADPSDGSVTEVDLGEVVVPLRRGRSPQETAQALYDEMKRAQAKLAGARSALDETTRRLGELGERPVAEAKPAPSPLAAKRARTPHWFQRYRWFVSSEGVLVIGGRDAESNDRIVRRYLGERDRYVHADIHGAPSVVVKHPGPGRPDPSDATMREAGQWGLALSKAWRAGLAAGDAFWVTADQVSKAGASGEFVPRGAWIIHGTKRTLRDLPLELGIGTIRYEGEDLWTVAPPSALRSRGELRLLLVPGEERRRAEVERELARELGLSRAVLQPLLPSGGLTVRRA